MELNLFFYLFGYKAVIPTGFIRCFPKKYRSGFSVLSRGLADKKTPFWTIKKIPFWFSGF